MGHQASVIFEAATDGIAHRLVLAHPFGNDVLSAHDGGIGVGHFVAVDKLACTLLDVVAALCHDDLGQRLQSQLSGSLGARLALGLEGQIDVLERIGIPAVVDAVGQFGSELLLRLDGLEDGSAAFLQFAVVAQSLVDGLDGEFVEVTSLLLAVAADEWDCRAVVKQIDGAGYLVDGDIELLGDERRELSCHILTTNYTKLY